MSPVAPGTVGSLAPTLAALLCWKTPGFSSGLIGTLCFLSVLSVPMIHQELLFLKQSHDMPPGAAAVDFEKKQIIDPSFIVIDEVIGQLIVFVLFQIFHPLAPLWIVLGFVLFRLFDILKPWPIRQIEKALERRPRFQALSVVLDDVLAGIFAAIALLACFYGVK